MGNKKVLACQIDEELRAKMEEQRKNKKLSVKDYIIGLIEQDLRTNSFEINANENLNKVQETLKKDEEKQQATKEKDSKEKNVEKSKKEESKQQPNIMNKKQETNKSKAKKIQKEEEDEFE